MSYTNTITKSVILQPGEQFILPPGATLIGASNSNSLSSTCDIINLESTKCYAFVFGNAEDDGNNAQLFEANATYVIGVSINGVYTDFAPPFQANASTGQFELSKIVIAINKATGGAMLDPVIGEHREGDVGIIEFIVFKALPSIAQSLELKMVTSNNDKFNAEENIEFWIKPRLHSTLSAYSGLPGCS